MATMVLEREHARVSWSTVTTVLFSVVADSSKLPSDGIGVGLGAEFGKETHTVDDFEKERAGERLTPAALHLSADRRRAICRGDADPTATPMSTAELDELEQANAILLEASEISTRDGGSSAACADVLGAARYTTAAPDEARCGVGGGFAERDDALDDERRQRLDEERTRKAARKAKGEKCPRCHRAACLC